MYDISVVIPTYNREKYIKNAVESVLAQKGQNGSFSIREIIIVDDDSADRTEEVIKGIDDDRIMYIRLAVNSGAAEARNAGVKAAGGEWIAFQDSDDLWHEDKIEKQIKYLAAHQEICMVSHPVKAVFEDGSVLYTGVSEKPDMIPELAERNFFDTPTILVKKDCFMNAGGFDRRLKALEDWDFSIRFADKYKIGMVNEILLDSQMVSNGISSGARSYYESRCKMIARNKDIFLRHNCFDRAVRSLLTHAGSNDVLDEVGRILELSLMEQLSDE